MSQRWTEGERLALRCVVFATAALVVSPGVHAAELVPTWEDVTRAEVADGASAIYPDPFRADVVWLASGDGIFYSDDAGDTWVPSLALSSLTDEVADLSDVEDIDAIDDLDAAGEGGDGVVADLESTLEELREEIIEELSLEFELDRDDVEIVIPEELEFRFEERAALVVASRVSDEPTLSVATRARISSISSCGERPTTLFAVGTAGLFKTIDDGRAWEELSLPEGAVGKVVAVSPRDPDHVLVGATTGLLESVDGGTTWEDLGIPEFIDAPVHAVSWAPGDPDRIAAVSPRHFGVTTDGGRSWITRDIETATGAAPIRAFTFVGAPEGRLVMAVGEFLWRSDDGGESWLPAPPLEERAVSLTSAPGSGTVWMVGRTRIWRSTDGGESWGPVVEGWSTARARAVAADPRPDRAGEAWAVSSAGIFHFHKISLEALTERALRTLDERFAGEPSLEATLAAAIRAAHIGPELLHSMRNRMKWAPLLPRVRLTFNFRMERDESLDGFPRESTSVATDRDYYFFVLAAWDLPSLIYNSSERRFSSHAPALVRARDDMVDRVVSVFGQRRATALDLIRIPPADVSRYIDAELKLMALTAELDVLTGGWFSRSVAAGTKEVSKKGRK